jgi:hypothetical protein
MTNPEDYKLKIEVGLNAKPRDNYYYGNIYDFRNVIDHEITHQIQGDQYYKALEILKGEDKYRKDSDENMHQKYQINLAKNEIEAYETMRKDNENYDKSSDLHKENINRQLERYTKELIDRFLIILSISIVVILATVGFISYKKIDTVSVNNDDIRFLIEIPKKWKKVVRPKVYLPPCREGYEFFVNPFMFSTFRDHNNLPLLNTLFNSLSDTISNPKKDINIDSVKQEFIVMENINGEKKYLNLDFSKYDTTNATSGAVFTETVSIGFRWVNPRCGDSKGYLFSWPVIKKYLRFNGKKSQVRFIFFMDYKTSEDGDFKLGVFLSEWFWI